MKKTILFSAILFSSHALAQGSNQGLSDNFSANKSKIIENLNKEKSIIDSEISCINSAATREDAKKCHDQKRAQMDALRGERKEFRQNRIDQRREKLNEKMNENSAQKSE